MAPMTFDSGGSGGTDDSDDSDPDLGLDSDGSDDSDDSYSTSTTSTAADSSTTWTTFGDDSDDSDDSGGISSGGYDPTDGTEYDYRGSAETEETSGGLAGEAGYDPNAPGTDLEYRDTSFENSDSGPDLSEEESEPEEKYGVDGEPTTLRERQADQTNVVGDSDLEDEESANPGYDSDDNSWFGYDATNIADGDKPGDYDDDGDIDVPGDTDGDGIPDPMELDLPDNDITPDPPELPDWIKWLFEHGDKIIIGTVATALATVLAYAWGQLFNINLGGGN